MPNIEMKARCPDLSKARETAVALGGNFLWKDLQRDTYFHTKTGKLKLRESGLNGSELLPYIKTENDGLKRSDYAQLPVQDAVLVRGLFDQLLGTAYEVRKEREVYLIGNVRVHLDEVVGLGNFIEFEAVFTDDSPSAEEAETRKVAELMQRFGVRPDQLFSCSYPELLAGEARLPS